MTEFQIWISEDSNYEAEMSTAKAPHKPSPGQPFGHHTGLILPPGLLADCAPAQLVSR
jgi:hypothetical protein